MLSLSSISIRRPVLATVMSLVIILFGILGFNYLGVREYPNVDPPKITVTTNYQGADAEIIETQITEPLEESINGIAGIKTLNSVSRDGRSTITAEFSLNTDLEAAANDVRDKVSQARRNLPDDSDPPVVRKADADATPIVFLNIKSQQRSLLELTEMAENDFKEQFQTIPGVSEVHIWGEKKYSMRLWMDPAKMHAYHVTPADVKNALDRENIELPSGRIEGRHTELTIRTMGRLKSVEEFNDLIIKETDNRFIRFDDIGHAELGPENMRTILRRDGTPMVGNVLIPQAGANYIEIVDRFYKKLEDIKKDLPPDIELGIGFDKTRYIRASIREVEHTIFIAFFLVIGIIFLFLRDWRTTLIPIIVIPIALTGSFFILFLANYSINVLTLLGIVLAIGLVVDDAIVVMENIYVKIENGMEPVQAGIKGTAEIFFAVIATTLSLAAVFLPIIFLQGLTGRLFREFGVMVAGAVVISSFVALTFTPMLSTRLLKKREKHNRFYNRTEGFFRSLINGYRRSLQSFMGKRWFAWIILIFAGFLSIFFFRNLPSELAPVEDRNNVRIFATGPEGATFEYMDQYMDTLLYTIENSVPEVRSVIMVTSPGFGASTSVNSGFMRVMLTDKENRARSQSEIARQITGIVNNLSGARAFVSQEQTIGGGFRSLPVEYVVQAPNMKKLEEVLSKFIEKARSNPIFSFVDVNLKFNKPELQIEFDRNKARTLGINARDIAHTLQLALSGQRYGYFIMNGKQYQIIGQLKRENRNEPADLGQLYVRNNKGKLIPLENLLQMKETSSPPTIYRYDRYVSATVSAGLVEGKTVENGINAMDEIASGVLDDKFATALSGTSEDYAKSASSLIFAFVLALLLVYLVLSAQFESFRDPLVIMITVPLAVAGAFISIWYFDQTLNIFSQIGMIMLIGLVTKNGILIVEFANQRKAAGLDIKEAAIDAASRRFRPILMTSLSTILGILPIALALGAGAESRQSMGIAVIGGLAFATILTLYVIPAVYTFISEEKKQVSNVAELTEEKKATGQEVTQMPK